MQIKVITKMLEDGFILYYTIQILFKRNGKQKHYIRYIESQKTAEKDFLFQYAIAKITAANKQPEILDKINRDKIGTVTKTHTELYNI